MMSKRSNSLADRIETGAARQAASNRQSRFAWLAVAAVTAVISLCDVRAER